jgi:hypothetical protein
MVESGVLLKMEVSILARASMELGRLSMDPSLRSQLVLMAEFGESIILGIFSLAPESPETGNKSKEPSP